MLKKTAMALALGCALSLQAAAQTTGNGPYYASPSWDQQLPAAQRFIVLSNWNNEAVLDRETGLVWQRSPVSFTVPWLDALNLCYVAGNSDLVPPIPAGGRHGWRLPSVEELASLIDSTQSNPGLPAGHPFVGIQRFYWTSTSAPDNGVLTGIIAYEVDFGRPLVDSVNKATSNNFWCVRGGSSTQVPVIPPS